MVKTPSGHSIVSEKQEEIADSKEVEAVDTLTPRSTDDFDDLKCAICEQSFGSDFALRKHRGTS